MNTVLNTKFGVAKQRDDGYYQIDTSKEGNHKKLLHRLIFEDVYGFIPKNFNIHHKNGDKSNNCILNLQLISSKEHSKLHHTNKDVSLEYRLNKSKAINSTGIFRVHIAKSKSVKQGFFYVYRFEKNGKIFKTQSVSLSKLKQKVIANNWEWIVFEEQEAKVNE